MDKSTKLLSFLCLFLLSLGLVIIVFAIYQKPVSTPKSQVSGVNVVAQNAQLASDSATSTPSSNLADTVLVTRVIDGDTIIVEGNQTIRIIGVDTPETVDPKRPVGCFGKEASNEMKSLLTNKRVVLEKDIQDTDKYHRLLRYVYLPLDNGTMLFIDDYLIREGFGKTLNIPPDNRYAEQFNEAQVQAKQQNRGLWKSC